MFIRSAAFADDPTWLLLAYNDYPGSLIPHADSLFAISEVLSGPLVERTRGFTTDLGHDVMYVPPLLLRLYEQAQDQAMPGVQNKCLDAWDLLFENRVGMTRDLNESAGSLAYARLPAFAALQFQQEGGQFAQTLWRLKGACTEQVTAQVTASHRAGWHQVGTKLKSSRNAGKRPVWWT